MLILFPDGQLRSGKIGSLTFSKSGYVSPTKLHSLPKNHVNTKVQSVFQLLSAGYKDGCLILPSFKEAWDAYSVVMVNRVGTSVTLSGKAAFIRINMNLLLSGQTPIVFPNVNSVAPSITHFGLTLVSHSNIMITQIVPNASLTAVNVFGTIGFSRGKVRADNNMFRKISTLDCSINGSNNIFHAYTQIFGRPHPLNRISFYCQAISPGGLPSSIHQINRIIT